jgi:prefoldin subunit 5
MDATELELRKWCEKLEDRLDKLEEKVDQLDQKMRNVWERYATWVRAVRAEETDHDTT